MPKTVTAALLLIGNELLSGRTPDQNLHHLAEKLTEIGINLSEARVVKDNETDIVDAVNTLRQRYDYVFTTGGIGPTHDDITSKAIANAFEVPFERNQTAEAMLQAHYKPEDLNDARLRMADMPAGVTLLLNPISAAPGFKIDNVFVMAGVPVIMQATLENAIQYLTPGDKVYSVTVVLETVEGKIAAELTRLQDKYADIEIGSYPYLNAKTGQHNVSVVFRGHDQTRLEEAAGELKEGA